MLIKHPTKGTFDTAAANWRETYEPDGSRGAWDIGTSPDGTMVAIRDHQRIHDPNGCLVFSAEEWSTFSEGVNRGDFDDEQLHAAADLLAEESNDV